jgi:hypothetical protein
MVFHPDSHVAQQRDKEEAEEYKTRPGRISNDALTSLEIFSGIRMSLPEADRASLEIRAIRETNLYCSVIRVDDKIIATKYLMSRRGSKSPTLEITGFSSPFFQIFAEEFTRMWTLAVEWPPPVGAATY